MPEKGTIKVQTEGREESSAENVKRAGSEKVGQVQKVGKDKDKEEKKKESGFEKPEVLLSWRTPSREFTPKEVSYFAALFVITVLAVLVLVFLKEYTLAMVTAGVAFVLFALNKYEPPHTSYELLNVGIKVQDREFRWGQLWSFFIKDGEPFSVLHVRTVLTFPRELVILFPKEYTEKIEKKLLEYLDYEEHKARDVVGFLDGVVETFPFNPDAPMPRKIRSLVGRIFGQGK